MGIWRQKIDDLGCEAAADLLYEMQMSVSSLSWAGGFTGSEGNSFKLAVEDGLDAIYQAHMLGAKKLIIHPGSRNNHTHSHALRLLRDGIRDIMPIAQDLGVQILLEPVVTKKNSWTFLNDLNSYREIMDEFDKDEVGLVLDLFHIGNRAEFAIELPKYADRIALVQLADGRFRGNELVRCPLGAGIVPVESWLSQLAENNYNGDFEIELHGSEFEDSTYESTLTDSHDFIAKTAVGILSSTPSS